MKYKKNNNNDDEKETKTNTSSVEINTDEIKEEEEINDIEEEVETEEKTDEEEDPNKVEINFKEDKEDHKFNIFDLKSYIGLNPFDVLNEYSKSYQEWYTQREDEPEKAYDLFRKYAEMKDVTLKEFSKTVDASLSTIKSYSSKYDWKNRKREKENIERKEEIKNIFKENKEVYENIRKEKINFIQDISTLRTQKQEQHKKIIEAYTESFEKLNVYYQSILDKKQINWDDYDKALNRIKEIQNLINEENEKHEKNMTSLINQINDLENDLRPHHFHHHGKCKNKHHHKKE
jgi:hypothetical protein